MNRWKRLAVICLCCVLFLVCFSQTVFAAERETIEPGFLSEQLEQSGANDLPNRLTDEAADALEEIGVEGVDLEQLEAVSAQDVIAAILKGITNRLPAILQSFFFIIAVMLLSALVNSMQLSLGEQPVGGVVNLVGMLCVVGVVITPVVSCIGEAAAVVSGGAYFMLGCIPVMIGFLIASGQTAAGTSFSMLLMTICNVISFLSANLIVPVLNIFLGFSVVSSVSPNLNLNGLCKSFYTVMKWILGFGMTIFSGMLTIQGLLGGAIDVTTNKSVKFVVSSFVPVVGTALGEAFGTIHSCAKVLKSGVGAFGILGILFIFLPILLQCILWAVSLSVAAGIGDVFELKEISGLLRSVSKVITMLIAVLLCCVVMLVVALEIMMMSGGSGL